MLARDKEKGLSAERGKLKKTDWRKDTLWREENGHRTWNQLKKQGARDQC